MAAVAHVELNTRQARVIVCGDAAVGKTTLCRYLSSGEYRDAYVPTGTAFDAFSALVKLPEGSAVSLLLLDAPGASVFSTTAGRDSAQRLWQSGQMLALCFGVDSRSSFVSCAGWLRRYQESKAGAATGAAGKLSVPGVLIGLKADAREDGRAEVDSAEARSFAAAVGLEYFELSCALGKGCAAPFDKLAASWTRIQQNAEST